MIDRSLIAQLFEGEPNACYVVVVPPARAALCRRLEQRVAGDARMSVVLDRRRPGATDVDAAPPSIERRLSTPTLIPSLGVAVVRLTEDRPTQGRMVHEPAGRRMRMTTEGMDVLGDRQRVDRWLEESQYLIGRMLPAYLDDRDRARARLETVEGDNERLRIELADARREIAELRGELDAHRMERARVAESFHAIVEHLAVLQGPVSDIASRLQISQPAGIEARS